MAILISITTIIFLIIFIFLSVFIFFRIRETKYKNFIYKHSIDLVNLKKLNQEYQFKNVNNLFLERCFDNPYYYDDILPKDFLVYSLISIKKQIKEDIETVKVNAKKWNIYFTRVKNKCTKFTFDTEIPFKNIELLKKLLTKIINSNVKTAKTSFFATVRLIQTNYYGGFVQAKNSVFSEDEILETIHKLEQKNNGFYLNSDIWDSIVKIERAKVSNRLRFQIYERDGYRCRKCGSNENLEIDHIYPISKGGKTELSNLQTLCRNCNLKKGNSVY